MSQKSLMVAQCLLNLARLTDYPVVTPMKLLKLIYIAHGYLLAQHHKPLLDEQVQAYTHGPIVASVYKAVRHFRSQPVTYVPGAPKDLVLTEFEVAVIQYVIDTYGPHDAVALSAAMHCDGSPWRDTRAYRDMNGPISNDLIQNFYLKILRSSRHTAL